METDIKLAEKSNSKSFLEAMVRFGLIVVLTMLCFRISAPFVGIIAWGLVLAVMLYPLHQRWAKRMGGRHGYAATLIVLIGILMIGVPMFKLGNSTIADIQDLKTAVENDALQVMPADPAVAEWPLIGEKLYTAWDQAATDLSEFMEKYGEQLRAFSLKIFSKIASIFLSVLSFLGALIVAGIMMAWGEAGSAAMRRIISRVVGSEKGLRIQRLSTATTRSVATGVLGVAFIQALLFSIGFLLANVPAAGMLGLLVMLLGIVQVPAAIVALPVIAYVWSSGDFSNTINILLTVYFIVAGLCDNFLKPLLLGRGVEAPMPVILIGAMGGIAWGGIIGLFLGAIILAVGYRIFMDWVDEGEAIPEEETQEIELGGKAAPSGE